MESKSFEVGPKSVHVGDRVVACGFPGTVVRLFTMNKEEFAGIDWDVPLDVDGIRITSLRVEYLKALL